MNYETIKSFVLFVLVGISLLLSYILWSYQPNYDLFYDTSYVNEVNVGGSQRTKNELIEPKKIVFRDDDKAFRFSDPLNRQEIFKDLASWVLYDYEITDSKGRPKTEQYVEIIFPSLIPGDLITNLFTFHDQIEPPKWSFERVFIVPETESQMLTLVILSVDERKQITATIEKADAYQSISTYFDSEHNGLEECIVLNTDHAPIYFPKNKVELTAKTLVAGTIEPESFINALFTNPNLVKSNVKEAYFTDGQRGMKIGQDGRRLEYINPIQSSYDKLDPIELFEKSVNHINDHRGWTNEYLFDKIDSYSKRIRFRMNYEGYPVFDYHLLSIIEQEWREQELYEYSRPLIYIGNLLSSIEVELPSGKEVFEVLLEEEEYYNVESIRDIQVGYSLNYIDEAHSLTLEPGWFILYEDEWMKFNLNESREEIPRRD